MTASNHGQVARQEENYWSGVSRLQMKKTLMFKLVNLSRKIEERESLRVEEEVMIPLFLCFLTILGSRPLCESK